jgi:aminoglycoside phosphotransferase (APT) family kinase protein
MTDSYAPSSAQGEPPAALRELVEAALGSAWLNWTRPETGLSAAHRYVVELASGGRVFVKAATDPETAGWLRNERIAIEGAPRYAPAVVAWLDPADAFPVLVVEALDGHWPASHRGVDWREGDLARVLASLHELSQTAGPTALPKAASTGARAWRSIAQAPDAFLGLGLCSRAWFTAHGAALAQAEERLDRSGRAFVHGDMRSDNICMMEDGPRFVDWSHARRGHAHSDLATFLPTAHLEGGPAPSDVLPEGGAWGAAQSAALARRASDDAAAPAWLARVFRRLAAINLDWAVAGLGLDPRDGAAWRDL